MADVWLYEHSEHLLGGDHQQSEGQVCAHLDGATHTDMPSSVLLVQMGIDPLDRAALAVTHGFGGRELAFHAPTRIIIV